VLAARLSLVPAWKGKMRAWISFLIMALAVQNSFSQTNFPKTILTTNYVEAVPTFREIDGRLYNTEQSTLFRNLEGNCLEVETNGLLIELVEPVWGRMDESPLWIQGNEYMGMNPSQRVRLGSRETAKSSS
jgi:hypothetical protein